mmetsp:Transcript_7472/g.11866  ORF Transcript_7472/g.11866 Transcript_7472/m.11866 type:complete len:132 (+) Transcript_7472:275-670(+)
MSSHVPFVVKFDEHMAGQVRADNHSPASDSRGGDERVPLVPRAVSTDLNSTRSYHRNHHHHHSPKSSRDHDTLLDQWWHMNPKSVQFKECIGSGHFGDAWRARWKHEDVVIKTLPCRLYHHPPPTCSVIPV